MDKINPELKSFQLNNTGQLLSPILNCFSNEFKNAFIANKTLCYAVGDCKYSKIYKRERLDPFLFVLMDRNGEWMEDKKRYLNPKDGKKKFNKNLQVMKKDPHYITDYSWSYLDNRHVIAFHIPKKYYKAFDKFIKGEYSQMYSEDDTEVLKMKSNKITMSIITKDKNLIPFFEKGLNDYYRSKIVLDDSFDGELSLPFIPDREVFNWHSDFKFLLNAYKEVAQNNAF